MIADLYPNVHRSMTSMHGQRNDYVDTNMSLALESIWLCISWSLHALLTLFA